MRSVQLVVGLAMASLTCLAQDSTPASQERPWLSFKEEIVPATVPFKTSIFSSEKNFDIYGVLWTPRLKPADPPRRFPLFVFNHGSQDGSKPYGQIRVQASGAVITLVENGFAVLAPVRNGFWRPADQEPPVRVDLTEPVACNWGSWDSGLQSAKASVKAVMAKLQDRSDIDLSKIVFGGQSRGGFLSLALAAENPPGLIGVVNLAGGWHGDKCGTGGSYNLSKYTEYGKQISVPVFSYYGGQDPYYTSESAETYINLLGVNKNASGVVTPGYNHSGHFRDYEPWVAAATRLIKPD